MEDIIDDITSIVEDIRSELDYTDSEGFEQQIRKYCKQIDSKLSELTDSIMTEEYELHVMIPDDITAGEAISLKETINNWRREHGYGEL